MAESLSFGWTPSAHHAVAQYECLGFHAVSGVEILWVVSCIAVAAFAQSLAGFGFALLSVPMMQLVLSPRDAVVISTLIAAVSTTSQAIVDRKSVDRASVKRLTIASYLGMPAGLALFVLVSDSVLRLTLGVVVILAAVVLSRGFSLRDDDFRSDWALGILSGILATSTSTNGPPLVFVLQARKMSPEVFRSTINTIFSLANLGALVFFFSSGKVSSHSLLGALIGLPAMFVALRIGYSLRPRVSAEFFRKLVLVTLTLSGVSLLLKVVL
jgi:hypothetical protein